LCGEKEDEIWEALDDNNVKLFFVKKTKKTKVHVWSYLLKGYKFSPFRSKIVEKTPRV